MLSFIHEFVPIIVMIVLAEYTVRAARSFFAADRAKAFVFVARVPSWLLAIALTAILVEFSFHVVRVHPGQLFNTWMAAAIMLTVARIVLTWAYALMVLGTHILMATNYMRVPSGRRRGIALLISGGGAIVMASGTTGATVIQDMGLSIMLPIGVVLMVTAWVMERGGDATS